MNDKLLLAILSGLIGLVVGLVIMIALGRLGYRKILQQAKSLIEEANLKAENITRQATLEGKLQVNDLRVNAEKEIKELKQNIINQENKLIRREDNLNFRDETLTSKEKDINKKLNDVNSRLNELEKMETDLNTRITEQIHEYERIAQMTVKEAQQELMAIVEKDIANETAAYIREQEAEAKSKASEVAKNIIALAIQRYAQEETIEKTVSVISLPSEDMKGRIIGREGRNIRAIEQATGVDLIIDDTPECITISCFNPVRREVAKMAIEHLLKDGRIQPGRIEEIVYKMQNELDEVIVKTGEDAIFKLGLGKMNPELVKLVGTLKYRYSYGQNGLQHSIEVASIAGIMAAELGLNQTLAKRAGLLHDIGKALDFELEGSHVELGVKFAKKYGENDIVINAIASHHGDEEATNLISNLVEAADTLSAARPGARFESFDNYINRLEKLEEIANSFDGIDQSYAIQAGREIRVMAIPDKVSDAESKIIARKIRERIENELTYPGQVKVTVIREVRSVEVAK